MLISHICKFIYLKTIKTGGTSVEIYFEPFCIDPKLRPGDEHNRAPEVSSWGVVGSRGYADATWYNHMPAARIRELAGEEVWSQYFKFCVVRNPFDKVVSQFWYHLKPAQREALRTADLAEVRAVFLAWVRLQHFPVDRDIYCIDDQPVVDQFIRYERLQEGLETICQRLMVPWQPDRLERYKGEYRVRREHYSEYYDSESISFVERYYAWELEYFKFSVT